MNVRISRISLFCLPLLACGGGNSNGVDAGSGKHDGGSNTGGSDANTGGDGGSSDCGFTLGQFEGTTAVQLPDTLDLTQALGSQRAEIDGIGSDFGSAAPASFVQMFWVAHFGGSGSDSATAPVGAGGEFGLVNTTQSGGGTTGAFATPDWPTTFGPKSNIPLNGSGSADIFPEVFYNFGSDNLARSIYGTFIGSDETGVFSLTQAGSAVGSKYVGQEQEVLYVHLLLGSDGQPTAVADTCVTQVTQVSFNATVIDGRTNGSGSGSGSAAFAPEQPERMPPRHPLAVMHLTHRTF